MLVLLTVYTQHAVLVGSADIVPRPFHLRVLSRHYIAATLDICYNQNSRPSTTLDLHDAECSLQD
jgi:hypothetical protein